MIEREAERTELLFVRPAPSAGTKRPPLISATVAAIFAIRQQVKGGAGHEQTELDALGRRAEGGQHRPCLPRTPLGTAVSPVEQMVADPDRVEADRLRGRAMARYSGHGTPRSTSGSWIPTRGDSGVMGYGLTGGGRSRC